MNYLLVLCTLAIGHCLFIAVALLTLNKKPSNRLLALLLVLLALRIGKSIIGMFFESKMVYGLSVAGVVAMGAAGPVLWLLVRSLFNTKPVRWSVLFHFLPALFFALVLPWNTWKLLSPAYYALTPLVFIYIFLSVYYVVRNKEIFKADDLKWKWARMLLSGVSLLAVTFVLQISVYQPIIYTTNIIVAAVVFYSLSLWAIKRSRIFLEESKHSKSDHTEVYEKLGKQIQNLLEVDQVFVDSNLTVSLLAAKLKSQPYLVSKTINYFFKKSFSELLIQYRIKKAEQLLLSPKSKAYTIEAIAFESGFNTLSAFYSAFKKTHKTTPAQFRETNWNANMKIA